MIDVRNEDFSTSHIPSAVNVPYGEQWEDDTFLDQLISSVGDKGTVVFHCMHSKQRGPFCAKNFARRLEEVTLEHKPEVYAFLSCIRRSMSYFVIRLVLSGGFHDWDQTQNEKEKEK